MNKKIQTLSKEQREFAAQYVGFASRITRDTAKKADIELSGNYELFKRMRSVALEAMVNCVPRFDENNANGAKFETFCTPYIKGKLGHFIGRECMGIRRSNYSYHKMELVSLDEQIGDEEDSYTREETIASTSFDEWQTASHMKDLAALILKELAPEEVEVVKAKFWSKDSAEAFAELARKRNKSVTWVKQEFNEVMMKMREIAARKGLTLEF